MTRIAVAVGVLAFLSIGAVKAEHGKASEYIVACQVAEAGFCEHFSDGAFQAYEEMHAICPDHGLHSDEVWGMMKAYFSRHPDLRLSSFAAYVRAAASEKYPCANAKPSHP